MPSGRGAEAAGRGYVPRDRLFLWWLAQPAAPVLVGQLDMVRSSRGVSLRYAPGWVEHGFALSEDLPLLAGHDRAISTPAVGSAARSIRSHRRRAGGAVERSSRDDGAGINTGRSSPRR